MARRYMYTMARSWQRPQVGIDPWEVEKREREKRFFRFPEDAQANKALDTINGRRIQPKDPAFWSHIEELHIEGLDIEWSKQERGTLLRFEDGSWLLWGGGQWKAGTPYIWSSGEVRTASPCPKCGGPRVSISDDHESEVRPGVLVPVERGFIIREHRGCSRCHEQHGWGTNP